MNIFEIFSAGNGRISETNMTSALHFLLAPHASHGLGTSSLAEFLSPLSVDLITQRTQGRMIRRGSLTDVRNLVGGFKRIEITLEEAVFNPIDANDRRFRMIDLTVRCFTGDEAPALVIAIENKIAQGAATDVLQLAEEYDFLRAKINADYPSEAADGASIPIVFVYVTPDALVGSTEAQWSALTLPESPEPGASDFKAHYTWKSLDSPTARPASVTDIARSLLRKEQDGSISPASSHASLFLRSMIRFIANDFRPESYDSSAFEEFNSVREVLTPGQFWDAWNRAKPRSRAFAQTLHERVAVALAAAAQARGQRTPEERFTKTRLTFSQGTDRPIAIMLQNSTNGRVAIQVKQGPNTDFLGNLAAFQESDRVETKFGGINLEVQIPVEISSEPLDRLVEALVGQLP
jgi:hypothetical protein